jgi:hypothetical protein
MVPGVTVRSADTKVSKGELHAYPFMARRNSDSSNNPDHAPAIKVARKFVARTTFHRQNDSSELDGNSGDAAKQEAESPILNRPAVGTAKNFAGVSDDRTDGKSDQES